MDADALRALVVSMPTIEQAKGILIGCYGCDATAAFAILTRLSSSWQMKLRDVAALLVDAASHANEATHQREPAAWNRVRLLVLSGPSGQDDHAEHELGLT